MQQDTKKNQDTLYQDRLRRSRLVLETQANGIWEQIHGVVLSKNDFERNISNINKRN